MKKITAIVLAGTLCAFGIAVRAAADAAIKEIRAQMRPDFTISVDGEEKIFRNANGEQVYPVLYDGTTYLPVRAIGELMGKTVYWYEDEKHIALEDKKESTVTDADVIIPDSKAGNAEKDVKTETGGKAQDKNDAAEKFIGEAKAKEIALAKAGLAEKDITFTKVKLEFDDGRYVYEVEFRNGRIEYEFEINAYDGRILSYDKDIDD